MANKKRILVVEDDVMSLEVMRIRLEQSGFEVIAADGGKEGLIKAISEHPDLIIADVMMPELDGLQMIKILRANSDLKNTPIIVISALGREIDIRNAKEAGANDYIVKPSLTDEIVKKVKGLIK